MKKYNSQWAWDDALNKRVSASSFGYRNDGHHNLFTDQSCAIRVIFVPGSGKHKAYFRRLLHSHDAPEGSGQMTELHENGRDILYNRLKKDRASFSVLLKREYKCEFDDLCKKACMIRLHPIVDSLGLEYYDYVGREEYSALNKNFKPDIVLRNTRTQEELWVEIENTNDVESDKIHTDIPILARECKSGEDIDFIKSTRRIRDGLHWRLYNPQALPKSVMEGLDCPVYLEQYKRKKVKKKYFVHPDGRRYEAVRGQLVDWVPIDPKTGEWLSAKKMKEDGFVLTDIEE